MIFVSNNGSLRWSIQQRDGYSNLLSHWPVDHPDHLEAPRPNWACLLIKRITKKKNAESALFTLSCLSYSCVSFYHNTGSIVFMFTSDFLYLMLWSPSNTILRIETPPQHMCCVPDKTTHPRLCLGQGKPGQYGWIYICDVKMILFVKVTFMSQNTRKPSSSPVTSLWRKSVPLN